jgi:hypothetical protein
MISFWLKYHRAFRGARTVNGATGIVLCLIPPAFIDNTQKTGFQAKETSGW